MLVAVALLFGALATPFVIRTIGNDFQSSHVNPFVNVGLYDSDSATVTSGDLNSQDYWWTKFDAVMLEIALKQHQPEGRIGIDLAVALRRIDDLLKKYPKHEGILKWKAHFEEIQSKINPDANRSDNFNSECPWDESNFAQLWVNVHWMKFLVDQKNWNDAAPLVSNIKQNYTIMLAPDRMKNYPEDLRKWVIESKADSDKLAATVKSKTGG